MKKTIEKLLDKREIEKMSENDIDQSVYIDPDATMPSEEELHAKELLKKYKVKNQIEDSFVSAPLIKKKFIENFIELDDGLVDVTFENNKQLENLFEEKIGLGYNAIIDDVSRMESYNKLSKEYKLTAEQKKAANEIYGRIMSAENRAENIKEGYQQVTEKIKDVADVTRRMMSEINGQYINKSNDYKI